MKKDLHSRKSKKTNWSEYSTRVENCCTEIREYFGYKSDSPVILSQHPNAIDIINEKSKKYGVNNTFIRTILTKGY